MRLVMLPGLGADMRLFLPQLKAFHDSVTPGWIDPIDEDGLDLRAYATRFLPWLVESGVAPAAEPVGLVSEAASGTAAHEPADAADDVESGWGLIGFSFGGQVALEIARLVALGAPAAAGAGRLRGVVLIAANRSSETIPAEFRAPVDRWTKAPDWLVRPMLRFRFAGQFARQNGLSPQWTKRLKEMGSDADPAFLKWAARATARWAFSDTDGDEITGRGVPIYQLHGSRDDTIPLVERHADRIIEGPHLLTWTNPDEVNAFIAESFGLREAGSPTA